jgi:hypothetical protein
MPRREDVIRPTLTRQEFETLRSALFSHFESYSYDGDDKPTEHEYRLAERLTRIGERHWGVLYSQKYR